VSHHSTTVYIILKKKIVSQERDGPKLPIDALSTIPKETGVALKCKNAKLFMV